MHAVVSPTFLTRCTVLRGMKTMVPGPAVEVWSPTATSQVPSTMKNSSSWLEWTWSGGPSPGLSHPMMTETAPPAASLVRSTLMSKPKALIGSACSGLTMVACSEGLAFMLSPLFGLVATLAPQALGQIFRCDTLSPLDLFLCHDEGSVPAAALRADVAVARRPERQQVLAERRARPPPGDAEVVEQLVDVVREQGSAEVARAAARHHLCGPAMHAGDLPLHLVGAGELQLAGEARGQPVRRDLGAQLTGDRGVPADEADVGDAGRQDEAVEMVPPVTLHQVAEVLVEERDVLPPAGGEHDQVGVESCDVRQLERGPAAAARDLATPGVDPTGADEIVEVVDDGDLLHPCRKGPRRDQARRHAEEATQRTAEAPPEEADQGAARPVQQAFGGSLSMIAQERLREAGDDEPVAGHAAGKVPRHHPCRAAEDERRRACARRSPGGAVERRLASADDDDPPSVDQAGVGELARVQRPAGERLQAIDVRHLRDREGSVADGDEVEGVGRGLPVVLAHGDHKAARLARWPCHAQDLAAEPQARAQPEAVGIASQVVADLLGGREQAGGRRIRMVREGVRVARVVRAQARVGPRR